MKKKLVVAVASLVALMAVSIITLFVLRGKSPSVSDADLRFTRATVSSNENAFFILEQASGELFWPEGKETKDILDWKLWDPKLAREILHENQKALELIDKALLIPRLQVPEIQNFGEDSEYLGNWRSTSRVALLRSIAQFHEGKEKEAFNSTLGVIRFGHQIEDCGGEPIHYLVGSAVKLIALKTLRDLIANTTLPCDVMQSYLHELDQFFANEPGLTNVIKLEYKLQAKLIDDMALGKNIGITNSNAQRTAGILNKPFFNQGKTRQIFAEAARTKLKSIPQHFSRMLTNGMAGSTNDSTLQLILSGNAIGKILTGLSLPAGEKFLSKKCRENVNVSATRTLLALKCYKIKYGALPKILSDLVPEFLAAIPLDDFDGKPLRYSTEKAIIYSVGLDLIDSGGQETNSAKQSLDIPFKIEF